MLRMHFPIQLFSTLPQNCALPNKGNEKRTLVYKVLGLHPKIDHGIVPTLLSHTHSIDLTCAIHAFPGVFFMTYADITAFSISACSIFRAVVNAFSTLINICNIEVYLSALPQLIQHILLRHRGVASDHAPMTKCLLKDISAQ